MVLKLSNLKYLVLFCICWIIGNVSCNSCTTACKQKTSYSGSYFCGDCISQAQCQTQCTCLKYEFTHFSDTEGKQTSTIQTLDNADVDKCKRYCVARVKSNKNCVGFSQLEKSKCDLLFSSDNRYLQKKSNINSSGGKSLYRLEGLCAMPATDSTTSTTTTPRPTTSTTTEPTTTSTTTEPTTSTTSSTTTPMPTTSTTKPKTSTAKPTTSATSTTHFIPSTTMDVSTATSNQRTLTTTESTTSDTQSSTFESNSSTSDIFYTTVAYPTTSYMMENCSTKTANDQCVQCCAQCSNLTAEERMELIRLKAKEFEKILLLEKMNLKSTIRKKISAPDKRTSSAVIGYSLGVGCLIVTAGIIVLLDFSLFFRIIRSLVLKRA